MLRGAFGETDRPRASIVRRKEGFDYFESGLPHHLDSNTTITVPSPPKPLPCLRPLLPDMTLVGHPFWYQDHSSVGVMYMLGPDLLKLMPSAYTVAQELEKYKIGVLKARVACFFTSATSVACSLLPPPPSTHTGPAPPLFTSCN